MEGKSRFSRLLKEARLEKGWNQKELCELLPGADGKPISESNISAWNSQGWAPEDRMLELVALFPNSKFSKAWAEGGLRKPPPVSVDLFETDFRLEKPPVIPSWLRQPDDGLPPSA